MATTETTPALVLPRGRRWTGWLRSLLARRIRRRPRRADILNLPDHMKRDIGLLDHAGFTKRR